MDEIPQPERRESWSYSGEVWTDGSARATVVLPSFVRAHHAGFDYDLVPIDAARAAVVVDEIVDCRFTIATDEPHVKVAWKVTPLRANDGAGAAPAP